MIAEVPLVPASSVATPARRLTIFVPHASDLLTDHHPHGDGLVAFEIVYRLAQRGHRVHVAAPRIDIRGPIPPTLTLHPLNGPWPHTPFGRIGYMLRVRGVFEELRENGGVDVVHQLNPVFTGISLALAGTPVPIVLGSFVSDWPAGMNAKASASTLARRVKRRIAALQQRHAAALLITTEAARARIIDERSNAHKIVTVPHGIDPALYRHVATRPRSAGAPSILFLGGIEERKGVFDLIDAFRIVHAQDPACRLIVAGTGGRLGDLADLVKTLPERDAISVLGRVSRSEVPRLMDACTVYCMPSYGEPFGMSLLEAMACAKPVVVTDAGGAGFIVDERGGRKVAPGDAPALAAALLEILTAPALQSTMGAHNRARIDELYSWERVIARLEDVYASVLARGESA